MIANGIDEHDNAGHVAAPQEAARPEVSEV